MENQQTELVELQELFTTLRERQITLWVEEDRLRSRAPKGALTLELRTEIGTHKEAIIAWLRQAQAAPTGASIPLQPRTNERTLPLSYAQERLWVLDQLTGSSATYNMTGALRLTGDLDSSALERSLQTIVERHEILRTTFVTVEGTPQQVINETDLTLQQIDLSQLTVLDAQRELQEILQREARRPFDLTQGPLLRVHLLKIAGTESDDLHLLLFNMHHIIADGWSHSIIEREVAALYSAFVKGEPSPLPPLSIQYADYALWQRQSLRPEMMRFQLAYWQRQLGQNPPVLNLPTDLPRPAVLSEEGARLPVVFSATLAEQLRTLSHAEGTTLFMTLLAAFDLLMHWYSGQDEIIVGTDVANRNQPALEELVGFFVNQLVMKTTMTGNPTFRELLAQVKEVALGAYAHQDLPFDKLVDGLGIPRDLSRSPLFQVKLVLQNLATDPFTLADLELEPIALDTGTAKFDLLLNLWDSPEGIQGEIEYSTELYHQATIEQMMQLYEIVLQVTVAQPESTVSQLCQRLSNLDKERRQSARDERKAVGKRKRQLAKRKTIRAAA